MFQISPTKMCQFALLLLVLLYIVKKCCGGRGFLNKYSRKANCNYFMKMNTSLKIYFMYVVQMKMFIIHNIWVYLEGLIYLNFSYLIRLEVTLQHTPYYTQYFIRLYHHVAYMKHTQKSMLYLYNSL